MNLNDKKDFNQTLINWYDKNKRDLPFRKTNNPYHIWISEIMLQQTQMITVIPYYERFIHRFKTIHDLANSDEKEVLKYWEGLGYYSRAKNIHHTAKEIVSKYDGEFPSDYETIKKLKGIGSYTAGAISSIAFNNPKPAVDGNVMRVLSRILDIWEDVALPKTKGLFEKIVSELIPDDNPSSFTQGLMELGALICKPKGQKCQICPVKQFCSSYQNGYDDKLPVKSIKTKQKQIKLIMCMIENEYHEFLVKKRNEKGLLSNFYEFVQIETKNINTFKEAIFFHDGIKIKDEKKLGQYKHIFTHLIWDIQIYHARIDDMNRLPKHFIWMDTDEISAVSFTTAHRKIMDEYL